MADVVEINNLDQLEQYRLAWNALLPQTPKASFFHSFDWLKLYWQHFGSSQALRVLVVRSQGNVIGIVPLCVKHRRTPLGKVRVLTYPLANKGAWYGPIGPNQAATIHMAVRHLSKTTRDWDLLDLPALAAPSNNYCSAANACKAIGWQPQMSAYKKTATLPIADQDYQHFLASSEKKHSQLHQQIELLANQGTVTFKRHRPEPTSYGDGHPDWDLFEACRNIFNTAQKNPFSNDSFFEESHNLAAKLGMLDLAVLEIDGIAAAYQYNYHYHGEIFCLATGSAPSTPKADSVLLSWLIQDSFQRNDKCLNLAADSPLLEHLDTVKQQTSYRVTCYPHPEWRSQTTRFNSWLKSRFARRKQPTKATSA